VGTFNHELGPALRALRERARLSQKEMSQRLDMNQSWISRMETGRGQPSVQTIDQYLEITGTTAYDLVDLIYSAKPDPDKIADQILALFRLGSLTEAERQDALTKIRRLGFDLLLGRQQ